jgi:anti-sigma factor RsiW
MIMTREMLEILIAKYLDGEITPSEEQVLEIELDRDPQAKELLEQLADLHECSTEAVASEITGRGRLAEDVFEQAWQKQSRHVLRFFPKLGGSLRFAAGVAAGLLVGLTLHFALSSGSTPQGNAAPMNTVARNVDRQANTDVPDLKRFVTTPDDNVTRNVDWYSFTDKEGNQWLIEGLRENKVRPAAYSEGL